MAMTDMPQARFGLVDRVVAAFAPGLAERRFDSRLRLDVKRRYYDAAGGGRLNDGWSRGVRGSNADTVIAAASGSLRERSRDLVRNNPLAAHAVQVLVNNLVGPGIRPRAKSGNKARDKKVDKLFEAWSASCDAHGHTDFYGMQALAVREMVEGGDVFAVQRPLTRARRQRGQVPLEIELFEAEHLDESKQALSGENGRRISAGIEYDATGRRAAYWMLPEHPGDAGAHWRGPDSSVRLPVEQVAHLFERQRIQSRGVPWGAPAMQAIRDHGDWQLAEMVRKKTEACLVGVVLGDDNSTDMSVGPMIEDADGNAVETFRPGMLAYARGGKEVKFNQPGHAGGIAEWNRVQMHIIAAGFRVPYALMTGDLSQANFSSNRAGLNEFRRMIDLLQWQMVIPMFCNRVWAWFCDAAFTAGLIDTPDVPVEWAPPRFESVNPKQDAETDVIEVRAGFTSRSAKISARGYDPVATLEEIAADNAAADAAGLILDSDPRKTSRQGLSQEKASGAKAPGGDSDGNGPAPSGESEED